MRIACWSGPRNVSTALMRSFEARGDCAVVDEPLYAAFLAATGKDHPARDLVLASQPTDPVLAMRALRPAPGRVFEKHMAHHWQAGWPLAELGEARHVVLLRSPAAVVASYAKVREAPVPDDLGYGHLVWLAERLPVAAVVDGDALRADPAGELSRLCAALGLAYTPAMTSWPAGRRATDGVWARWWYTSVEASTGFRPPEAPSPVPDRLRWLVDAVTPDFERLRDR